MWKSWLIGSNWKRTLVRALILGLGAFVFFRMLLSPIHYQAEAMSPSIEKGQMIWVNRMQYFRSEPARGDVVAIRLAGDSVIRVARVIALEGEVVELRDGRIFVNDSAAELEDFQLPHEMIETGYRSEVVAPGQLFVLGDNRRMSLMELHTQGAMGRVDRSRVIGKVLH
ncbi:MAG: signal peptidase I [Bradymonadales bacterium]|nr:MAG: signal peptidase I [Bradymonadales bacterium]